MTDASQAVLLLTNRIVEIGAKPLTAGELWALLASNPTLSGLDADQRCGPLLAAGTAFAFARERLEEEGLRLWCALDAPFPARLRALGDACPAFLLVAGNESMLAEVDAGRGVAIGSDGLAAADGAVVVVPSEGLRVAARDPVVRRRVHASQVCLISPYAPNLRATASSAAGARRLIDALNGTGEQPSLFESRS